MWWTGVVFDADTQATGTEMIAAITVPRITIPPKVSPMRYASSPPQAGRLIGSISENTLRALSMLDTMLAQEKSRVLSE